MALLSPIFLNNRIIELEGHVAKQVRGAREALELAYKTIKIVQAETKRLGAAVIELSNEVDGLNRKLEHAEEANDVGFLRVRELIREVEASAKQLVQHAEVELASEIEGLRSELTG